LFGHTLCSGIACGITYPSIGVGVFDAAWEGAIGKSAVCVKGACRERVEGRENQKARQASAVHNPFFIARY